ncbi:MAG TPA: hypothetical protein VIH89_00960 [Candidatus Sulfotelmatobacter sp.]|jgi:hypothetical protein
MSSQVNVSQIGTGTSDPGEEWEVYSWTTSESEYNKERKRARFFTVVPDPNVRVEVEGIVQMEITRVWNMVRTTIPPNFKIVNVLQWNVAILNSGAQISAWELLQAETDN